MNILFTCAGRRTYLLKYFKEQLGDNGLIIAGDMQLSAPALTAADIKVQLPSVYSENYVPILLNICKTYGVDALFSLNDLELPILAKNKKLFKEIGVSPIVSDLELIDLCFDKLKNSINNFIELNFKNVGVCEINWSDFAKGIYFYKRMYFKNQFPRSPIPNYS